MKRPPLAVRTARILVAATIAVLALALPVPTQAHADDNTVGIAISPATKGARDARTRYSLQVKPGQKVDDQTIVTNVGSKELTITMLSADAYNNDNGDYSLRDSGVAATDAGSWVSFAGQKTQKIVLAAGKSQLVNFTVAVPANAKPGDHVAGIIASWTVPNGDIQVERRIASRLYVRVPGALQPVLTAANFSATYAPSLNPLDGTITLSTVISNSGNVALAGTVDVTATSWGGKVGGLQRVELAEILPGNSRLISVQLTKVPALFLVQPKLVLRSSISGDALDPGALPVIQRDTNVIAIPWTVLAVIALAVIAFFVARFVRRRNARLAAEWVAYQKAEAKKNAATSKSPAGKADPR